MSKQTSKEIADASALRVQDSASELYQIAILMLGDEEEAASLVEEALDRIEADPCADGAAAQTQARSRLAEIAVRRLAGQHPGAFSVPPPAETTSKCIDAEDLASAGMSDEELGVLIQSPGKVKVRGWLEQLAPALRAIFVLRAIVGQDGQRTAESLRQSGAEGAQGWQSEQVGSAYRQALCSLASSLVSSHPAPVLA